MRGRSKRSNCKKRRLPKRERDKKYNSWEEYNINIIKKKKRERNKTRIAMT